LREIFKYNNIWKTLLRVLKTADFKCYQQGAREMGKKIFIPSNVAMELNLSGTEMNFPVEKINFDNRLSSLNENQQLALENTVINLGFL